MCANRVVTQDEAIEANRYVHSYLINAGEYQKSPHFRPENQRKVRGVIERLCADLSPRGKAVDFGCGTGFVIALMKDLFDEVHGVDITPDMMRHVDTTGGRVILHESRAESTPFGDGEFDFATAYSFMDHLSDYRDFLREACRVLRPGGVLYADLNPNRAFIAALEAVERRAHLEERSPLIQREVEGALHNGAHYQATCGLDAEMLDRAEPGKAFAKGLDAREVLEVASSIGFSRCHVQHQWFLGEAKYLHGATPGDAAMIDTYLQSVLPVSSSLYKYLRFVFVK